MVNTRKYKKTKGGGWWPLSQSPQPVQVDPNNCTVIANKSSGDIDDINLDNLERLVIQRKDCRGSNESLEFTVNDEYIEGIIANKKQKIEDHKAVAKQHARENAAKEQLDNAENRIKKAHTNEDETAKKEFDECIKNKRDNREYPRECPNYDRFGKSPPRNVGGNRRTKRKHKKCKKAKRKRRSIKRRMNK